MKYRYKLKQDSYTTSNGCDCYEAILIDAGIDLEIEYED